jgi:hypothetical protein
MNSASLEDYCRHPTVLTHWTLDVSTAGVLKPHMQEVKGPGFLHESCVAFILLLNVNLIIFRIRRDFRRVPLIQLGSFNADFFLPQTE